MARRDPSHRPVPTPAECRRVARALLLWYSANRRRFPWRRKDATLYLHIVSEVLLQRTRAETVAAFLPVFLAEFPSWQRISRSSETELGQALRPVGLWRRRARTLQALAVAIEGLRGRWPSDREALETLPGVGQYVASAVLLFAFGQPEPLLDGGMARVIERVFGPRQLADIRYDPWLQATSRRLVRGKTPRETNWALLDLAALVCTPAAPRCERCPLARQCLYAATYRPDAVTGSSEVRPVSVRVRGQRLESPEVRPAHRSAERQ